MAVTQDFYKQGVLLACPKISSTRPFPDKIDHLAGNTETGRHKGFLKIWCPAGMPGKSFYTVRMNPSYNTAKSETRIEAVISSRRCAAAYTSLIV